MTSKLEKYLSKELYTRFGHLYIRQNYRPEWMDGLELDFYIEELKIAAEVQGDQHYRFVEHFHKTEENFEAQKSRDALKSILCRENKIRLVEIFTEIDADIFIKSIAEIISESERKSANFIIENVPDKRPKGMSKKKWNQNQQRKKFLNRIMSRNSANHD